MLNQKITSHSKIYIKCPNCDVTPIEMRNTYVCPRCGKDVGKYVQSTLQFHFPDLTRKDIFSKERLCY